MSVAWYGDAAIDHCRGKEIKYIHGAVGIVLRRAKELLSVAGTAQSLGRKAKGKRKGIRKGATVYGAARSKPGEPPRRQTGHLRRSVASEVDESSMIGRVGTNFPYGKYLELGTKRGLAPRPWLRRALFESQGEMNRIKGMD